MAQSVGGSLLSIGSVDKRKGIKKFAKSIGSKMHLKSKRKEGDIDDSSSIGSVGSLRRRNDSFGSKFSSKQTIEDADPGVVSEDDDEFAVSFLLLSYNTILQIYLFIVCDVFWFYCLYFSNIEINVAH